MPATISVGVPGATANAKTTNASRGTPALTLQWNRVRHESLRSALVPDLSTFTPLRRVVMITCGTLSSPCSTEACPANVQVGSSTVCGRVPSGSTAYPAIRHDLRHNFRVCPVSSDVPLQREV
jgi:hypothetical protein